MASCFSKKKKEKRKSGFFDGVGIPKNYFKGCLASNNKLFKKKKKKKTLQLKMEIDFGQWILALLCVRVVDWVFIKAIQLA